MRLAWMTDIHLEFIKARVLAAFLQTLKDAAPDAYIISGDIANAPDIITYLNLLEEALQKPIYFVLGNHDYYKSSIADVRQQVGTLAGTHLHWLNQRGVIELTPDTALIGHDGWSDGRYGDFMASGVLLNDYFQIAELINLSQPELLAKLNALGDEAAAHLRPLLVDAMPRYANLYIVMHPPPFQEAAWHEGKTPGDDDPYLPHFACKAVGDVLREIVPQHPDCTVTVLCGHVHGDGETLIYPNLRVLTGGAVYGKPEIKRIIDV